MAQTNQEQLDKNDAEFEAEFDKPDTAPATQTEDEAFGLGPEKAADVDAAAGAAGDATGAAAAGAPDAAAPAATDDAGKAAADAQAEQDARDAAAASTNVDEVQTTTAAEGEAADPADDPAEALAKDFGPEFVELLGRFIEMKCREHVGSGLNGMQSMVDSIIADLERRDHQAHFKAIQSAHSDFQEVVASSEFEAYRAAQAPAEQSDIDRVVASGSAQEIIDMLNKFKQSGSADGAATDGFDDEAAMDAAEGIRSGGGLQLPAKEPKGGSYEDAWNEK